MKKFSVALLGASNDLDRFSHKAFLLLRKHQYDVLPINPKLNYIDDVSVFSDLDAVNTPVHTLTIYVKAEISKTLLPQIIRLNPKRVIFNPGAENMELEKKLIDAGIKVINACTLVLLNTGQFHD